MPAAGIIKYAYLAYLAKPAADRTLYRLIRTEKACRIVELGIGSLLRTANLIAVAQRYSPQAEIHYSAVDWFDMRPDEMPPIKLIEAHRRLKATGAKIRVLPGEPGETLRSVANSLLKTDLLLIGPSVTDDSFVQAWYYLPRMCHPKTTVLRGSTIADGIGYRLISFAEIAERCVMAAPARAA
ncbi:MAG: hypothetical protein WD851_13610 [Pirellulales bacterium]